MLANKNLVPLISALILLCPAVAPGGDDSDLLNANTAASE